MRDQSLFIQVVEFGINIAGIFKNKLGNILKKINANKNFDPTCHELISKHYDTINGLISKLGEANKDEFERYYNIILLLEQTIVQLAQNCY